MRLGFACSLPNVTAGRKSSLVKTMELVKKLERPDLLLLCEELGIKVGREERESQLIKAIQECGAEDDEIEECWEEVEKNKRWAEEDRINEKRRLALALYQASSNPNNEIAPSDKKKKGSPAKSTSTVSHSEDRKKEKAFKARKPVVCHRCKELGHIAIGCRKPRNALCFGDSSDNDLEQLKPPIQELVEENVPRDSAATFDSVHPYSLTNEVTTGERPCAWQVVENESVCLPLARVESEGPFRLLAPETLVSQNLPEHYPSQNDVDMLSKGLCFGDESAAAMTDPMACESAHEVPKAESANEADCKSSDDEALSLPREGEALNIARGDEALRLARGDDSHQGETSDGEPAGLASVDCSVVSEVQTARNNAEDKPVEPPGVLSNVLPSIIAESGSVPCRPERKRRQRKLRGKGKGPSCLERRLETPKKFSKSQKLRVSHKSRLGIKRVARAKKKRRRSGRLVSSSLVKAKRWSKARWCVRDCNDKGPPPSLREGDRCSGRPTMRKLKRPGASLSEFGARGTKVTATECFGQVGFLSLRRDLAHRQLWYARPPRARLKGCRIKLRSVTKDTKNLSCIQFYYCFV